MLDLVRVDDADVTTAAAVVLGRSGGTARYLTAPWIAESGVRDLLAPDEPVRPVERGPDGVTEPVAVPTGGEECRDWPVLQLARAERTAACSRFGQHVLAGARWQADSGRWYQLAAGSRAVAGVRAEGAVRGEAEGPVLALPTGADAAPARLTGRLHTGGEPAVLK